MDIRILEDEPNRLPPADLAGEIERLQEGLSNERERNLRTLADFKNYRRRVEHDGNAIAEEGFRKIIIPLLGIVDDLEKALQWANDGGQPFVLGIRTIHQKFLALLDAHEVLPFNSIGTPFDHNLHEAVAMVKHECSAPGTIVDEVRRGYHWKNKLLRHAQVRVAE